MKLMERIQTLCIGGKPNEKEEVWFRYRWTPAHAGSMANDVADHLTNVYRQMWKDGLQDASASAALPLKRKWITVPILRHLLLRRVLDDNFASCKSLSEYLHKRSASLGGFRPPVGCFPCREAEQMYFWIWLGIAPYPHLGCDEIEYHQGILKQRCKFCSKFCDCAVDHVLFECPTLQATRQRVFGFPSRTPTLAQDMLKQPRKILSFVADEEARLTFPFFREAIAASLDKVGKHIEKPHKQHNRLTNTYASQMHSHSECNALTELIPRVYFSCKQ